jgi:hypothetical protein
MTVNNSKSAENSAATSTSGPPNRDREKSERDLSVLSESEYLAKEAEDAKQAVRHTLDDLKHSLATTADVRQWTKKYPWIATGTAIAAGVAAGYVLTPRDRDEAREMWEKLKEKLSAAQAEAPAAAQVAAAQQQPSLLGTILRETIKLAGPIIAGVVASAKEAGSQNQDGAGSTRPADQSSERTVP